MTAVGVLVPPYDEAPGTPESRPFGRAALRLEADGIEVVFGHHAEDGRLTGLRARPGRWEPVRDREVVAVYDRFPSQSRPEEYAALRAGLGRVPLANPTAVVMICRDKQHSQRVLEQAGVPMPELEIDPARFAERLAAWDAGFLKPRYGAFGRGVRRVRAGDPLPATVDGLLAGISEPAILQRAVAPPAGWAGVATRVLVQRTGPDAFVADHPVARRSADDPVVNAARGASVVPLAEAVPRAADAVIGAAIEAFRALAATPQGDLLVEVGVDVVVDPDDRPWVIEVNGTPRGRLEVLNAQDPERFGEAHVQVCARPIRFLATRFGGG